MYRFDLIAYQKYIDVLYLPSEKMAKYLGFCFPVIRPLPPGTINYPLKRPIKKDYGFNVLYVGGIGNSYNMHKLLRVVKEMPQISLTICCRKNEWKENLGDYEFLLGPNIKIVHVSGEDLFPLYEKADLASIFVENEEYRDFAMPAKLFEYISHCKPIISTKGTAVGDFVEDYGIGWSIPYDESSLFQLFNGLLENQSQLEEKRKKLTGTLPLHTWKSRALQVCRDLTS